MAALPKKFLPYLMSALIYKVRKDPGAQYYADPVFPYLMRYRSEEDYKGIFYYSRRLLPNPFHNLPKEELTEEKDHQLAEYLVRAYERGDSRLHEYVDSPTSHTGPEEEGIVRELTEELKNPPPIYTPQPTSTQTPPSAPKQPRLVRLPKEETEEEKETEKAEEVPKEQVAQQPPEQPPPSQPSQPTAPPSIPQMPSTPGVSIPRRFPKPEASEEAVVKQKVTRAPGFFRRGLGGLGRGIGPVVGGLGNSFLSNGGKLLNSGANAIQRLGGLRSSTAANLKKATSRRVLLIILLLIGGFGLISGLLPGGVLNPTGSPLTTGGEIASCKFTQAGQSDSMKSSKLASIIQEVSNKTGVPASVLASIAIHESPRFFRDAEDNHDAFNNTGFSGQDCLPHFATSPTGALGLMQVQPSKNIHEQISSREVPSFDKVGAHSVEGVKKGAEFLGKAYESLTMQDFCNVRTSVYLGAGVLLAKNSGKPPTTSEEVEKSVCGYFGNPCTYGGSFNYGQEAKKDFESCKGVGPAGYGPLGLSLTCPLDPVSNNNFALSCGTKVNPVNKCGHGGLSYPASCDPTFYSCPGGNYSEGLTHSLDVQLPAGQSSAEAPVSLPFANGNQPIKWKFSKTVLVGTESCNWGWHQTYLANFNGHNLELDITHVNEQYPISPADVDGMMLSGAKIGTLTSGVGKCTINPHLHTAIAIDGRWVEAEKEAFMCSHDTPPAPALITQTTNKTVVLDPGHCSNDKYGEKKVDENTLNLRVVSALASLLNKNGYDTKVFNPNGDGSCIEGDYYENLQTRVDFANNNRAAVFISVHADSGVQNDAFNPIYSQNGPFAQESIKLAQSMGREIKIQMATSGRRVDAYLSESTKTGTDQSKGLEYYVLGPTGSKTGGYYGGKVPSIIRQRNMPGIIMENYMITKPDYSDIYPYIESTALGYCNGIAKYIDNKACLP